jgi:hypothetical protein
LEHAKVVKPPIAMSDVTAACLHGTLTFFRLPIRIELAERWDLRCFELLSRLRLAALQLRMLRKQQRPP